MLLSRLIWASHKCELHSDESVLLFWKLHVFSPPPSNPRCKYLFQTPTGSVINATSHCSHKDKGVQWHRHSEWALRPNTWKQHPTSNEIREGTKQRELSILLLISWLTAILWLLLMAGLQYYCIGLVQITPFILKRVELPQISVMNLFRLQRGKNWWHNHSNSVNFTQIMQRKNNSLKKHWSFQVCNCRLPPLTEDIQRQCK